MNKALVKGMILVLTVVAVVVMNAPMIWAGDGTPCRRCGDFEFSLPIIYTDATKIDGSGNSYADVSSDWSTGFSMGYDINDHFLVNGLFSWSSRSYDAKAPRADGSVLKYNGTLDSFTMALNGTYYFLASDITPFVSGGIGWTFLDTNIPSGSSSTGCYWDPWWGYTCTSYVPTQTENDVSFNGGLGLRWDVTRSFALQASYNKMWVDISGASGMPDFDVYKMDLIFKFKE
jgi:opacity protein-like surface antigen